MIFDFFSKKDKQDKSFLIQDSIRGCMMAGAAGDALGYPVEFWKKSQIDQHYGAHGITQFKLMPNGKALVSDDTQMTLFTANGLLAGNTRWRMGHVGGELARYTQFAYVEWYYTQTGKLPPDYSMEDSHFTWLRDLPEMAHMRAPGITCMSACESLCHGELPDNFSKGCGGVMRVAPMGLMAAAMEWRYKQPFFSEEELALQAQIIVRMTHFHPLAYAPAAILTVLIARLIPLTPEEAKECIDWWLLQITERVQKLNGGLYAKEMEELFHLILSVGGLAQSDLPDATAISKLGEGWTADEALAIALFCVLRHLDSPRDAIIAAVNHDGDSDSTGSITGNIMGAIYGYEAIKKERLFCPEGKELEETLELSNIILALADDIFNGCCISKFSPIETPEQKQWYARYVDTQPAGIK